MIKSTPSHQNIQDGHGRNQLLISLEYYLHNKSVTIENLEDLIFTSDLKHSDLYLGHMDTLMSYFYYGPEKIPLSPGALEYLLLESNLNRVNLRCQNALLIALDKPQEHYSCIPYLIRNSNIHTQEISEVRNGQTTNALTKIFDMYVKDSSYDLDIESWEILFTTPLLKIYKGKENAMFEKLKHDVKYEKLRNHLEKNLEKKEDTKKVKI